MAHTQHTHSVAAYDNAPFFEKALKHAVQNNFIDESRLAELINDAATGSLQIAEYFDESIHLRKNLEVSMQRMVSLVSLYLEDATDADLDKAAQLLKDQAFRALSRGGSKMLKALYSLPEDEHFGSTRPESEREFLKKYLSKALSVTKYRQTFKDCEQFKNKINLATLLIKKLGSSSNEFNDMYASADHVIRTALLSLAYGAKKVTINKPKFPDEAALFEIFTSIRKEWALLGDVIYSSKFMDDLPAELQSYANEILVKIQHEDIPKIVNPYSKLESVLNNFKDSRYFCIQSQLGDLSRFDKMQAADWYALTGGSNEDALLLTLFFCASAGVAHKTSLKLTDAKKAVLNIRENGLLQHAVLNLIKLAPHDESDQLTSLWDDFIDEATPYLLDHADKNLQDVMKYLAERCHIQQAKK
jgi:hypothetical protein